MRPEPESYQPEVIAPPAENGVNLATIPRGQGEQLRITLAEYSGHPYIAVRVWALGADGRSWWPVKGKGVSIRLREIVPVGKALAEALRLIRAESDRPALAGPAMSSAPARPQGRPMAPRAMLPLRDPEAPSSYCRPGFDEFQR
jgi:hypothetical protein